MNYFLCLINHKHEITSGVGRCDLGPGIFDTEKGVILVASKNWVQMCAHLEKKSPYALGPEDIKKYVMLFWFIK